MRSSKRIVSVTLAVGSILGIGAASAADMAVKAPVYKAPPVVDPWVGFYVGANVGGSWGNWGLTAISQFTISSPSPRIRRWTA
jgi:hypothetical protein